MNITDLSYQDTATESLDLEGGILSYESGTLYAQHLQGLSAYTASGPGGSVATSNILDLFTLTFGGLNIQF